MKKLLTTTFLITLVTFTYGQFSGQVASNLSKGGAQSGLSAAAINNLLGPINEEIKKRNYTSEDFQGSPYTSDTFKPTTLFYKDEKIGNLFYRYNALNEEIEIKQNNIEEEGIRALGRDKAINIIVDGKPLSFKTFIDIKGKTLNGYLNQLVEANNYDLYRRIHVKYTEGSPAANSFVKAIPNRFSHFVEYYYQKDGVDRIDEIPIKNRLFLKLFDDDQKALVKDYLKENNLDVKNEQDLIQVFTFLNDLSS